MAGREIKLGDLLRVIPFVREIHLLFYDGNDKGQPHREETVSQEKAKEHYSDAKVAFIDKITGRYAEITIVEERKKCMR